MTQKTTKDLQVRQRELEAQMAEAINDAEKFASLQREHNLVTAQIAGNIQAEQIQREAPKANVGEQFRESLKQLRDRQIREVDFTKVNTNGGAVETNIHDIIDTINEGLELPAGCELVSGVEGNDLWPVSVSDVELQEVGENVALTDTDFDFDMITPLVKRAGVPVPISNKAIDNAAFDVLGFTVKKIQLAKRTYLASRIYSQAAWGLGNIVGPFSGLTPAGTITLAGGTAYADILKAVAWFTNKGLQGTPCLIMDAVTEADLKATQKAAGQGGFIIENGKCAGYNYAVSHYINTKLNAGGTALEATPDRYLGIGYFNYLAVQQHGTERLGLDQNSTAVMIKNEVRYVYNTEFSITDLSVKLNKKGGTTTQAFALYKLA